MLEGFVLSHIFWCIKAPFETVWSICFRCWRGSDSQVVLPLMRMVMLWLRGFLTRSQGDRGSSWPGNSFVSPGRAEKHPPFHRDLSQIHTKFTLRQRLVMIQSSTKTVSYVTTSWFYLHWKRIFLSPKYCCRINYWTFGLCRKLQRFSSNIWASVLPCL